LCFAFLHPFSDWGGVTHCAYTRMPNRPHFPLISLSALKQRTSTKNNSARALQSYRTAAPPCPWDLYQRIGGCRREGGRGGGGLPHPTGPIQYVRCPFAPFEAQPTPDSNTLVPASRALLSKSNLCMALGKLGNGGGNTLTRAPYEQMKENLFGEGR
jgi:hypothetical protein